MVGKRFPDEDVIWLLRRIEVESASRVNVAPACRSAGVSAAPIMPGERSFAGMGPSEVKDPLKSKRRQHICRNCHCHQNIYERD